MKEIKIVNPLDYKLSGSSLIEASAGTGKTWTIAALYLRMVLGHGGYKPKLPESILVLTFTKAAAQELKDRIRARLSQASSYFFDQNATEVDPFLFELKQDIPADKHKAAANLLDVAAQSMDRAAISTIHAWCQKVLKQHAFASASLFEQDLVENTLELKRQVAWDYWRVYISTLPLETIKTVNAIWQDPDDLIGLVKDFNANEIKPPQEFDLSQMVTNYVNGFAAIKDYWRSAIYELQQWFEDNQKNLTRKNDFVRWLKALNDWLTETETIAPPALTKTAWERLGATDIKQKYPDGKVSVCNANIAFDTLQTDLQQLDHNLQTGFMQHAMYHLSLNLLRSLAKQASQDFDGLLTALNQALHGANGEVLAQTLRKQYPVVLVDEFQDTDPIQYSIFDKIYQVKENHADINLVFIGDPKQSIYRFRNADIYTYLQAVEACAGRVFTLNKNYRSADAMVAAVNEVFAAAAQPVFITGQKNKAIEFYQVKANGLNEVVQVNGQTIMPISALAVTSEDGKAVGVTKFREVAGQACAAKISNLLYLASDGFAELKQAQSSRAIAPSDIAILVNSKTEAKLIKGYLAAYNVPSVFLSEKASVYKSPQAQELKLWLDACIDPQNAGAVKAALASLSLGLSIEQLDRLNSDELLWELYIEKFVGYRKIWESRGVLPMVHRFLHDFAVPASLLSDGYEGERKLTNILHLAELLQTAASKLDGKRALLNYFALQIIEQTADEADELRLESDEDLVKIITVHKSKGLEYPLVFLPFACCASGNNKNEYPVLFDNAGKKEWLFTLSAEQIEQESLDNLGEDIRKLYVALTRARHGVWLALADTNGIERAGISKVLGVPTLEKYKALMSANPSLFALEDDTLFDQATLLDLPRVDDADYQAKVLQRPIVQGKWWVSSYSALNISNIYSENLFVPDTAIEDGLHENLAVSVLEDELVTAPKQMDGKNYLENIPTGATTGVFLHNALQIAASKNFSDLGDAKAYIRQRCIAFAWEEHIEALNDWLTAFGQNNWQVKPSQTINLQLALANLAEMEFLLPVNNLPVNALDDLVSQNFYPDLSRPILSDDLLNGMFKGFIDLCVQAEDHKYYIIDYKSNYLGDKLSSYDSENLIDNMLAMRYDVQMFMYLLALHRQLKARLPDYDYEKDMGGAIYMYLRGQNNNNQGLVFYKPPLALIEQLDQQFMGQVEHADD